METQLKLEEQMDEVEKFNNEIVENLRKQKDKRSLGIDFIKKLLEQNIVIIFMVGRPIIQYPQDIIATQELI